MICSQTQCFLFIYLFYFVLGTDEESRRMEMFELINHPYYVATQFHCEYLSRPLRPAPPFLGLLLAACKKLDQHLKMVR